MDFEKDEGKQLYSLLRRHFYCHIHLKGDLNNRRPDYAKHRITSSGRTRRVSTGFASNQQTTTSLSEVATYRFESLQETYKEIDLLLCKCDSLLMEKRYPRCKMSLEELLNVPRRMLTSDSMRARCVDSSTGPCFPSVALS